MKPFPSFAILSLLVSSTATAVADQIINENLIVRESLSVGLDSSSGEDFGFNTLILKENNLRILFDDTSTSASFPDTDWQLTANESANGGKHRFSIDDVTNDRMIFAVEAAAPQASLYVRSNGNLGIRTDGALQDIHINSQDSPAIRLDQNTDGGLPNQVWDLIGNESGLLFSDATNSAVPLKVKPGAASNTLVIDANGAAIGSGSASNLLHVREDDDEQAALIEITHGVSAERTVLQLSNNGPAALSISNTTGAATASDWNLTVDDSGSFVFSSGGSDLLTIDSSGNITTAGSVNPPSDRNRKQAFAAVDSATVLENVAALPIQTWRYRGEDVTHIGPMAQDFHEAFAVGANGRSISTVDADGVAFASIQALHADAKAKEEEISELKKENQKLEERLRRIEKLLESK